MAPINKKIVLIDDEPDFVQNVQSYFTMFGYTCFGAHNGQEGLVLIEKERPHLVILDILMPNMDGYTMLRELKKRKIQVMCIVLTAKERLKDLFELEKVDRFLTKPFDLAKLKEIVDELLAQESGVPADVYEKKTEQCSGKTILLIEDEIKLAESVKHYLELKEYVVHAAFSGEEGLRSAMTCNPDLIVTDILMPRMDGYTMLKELRKVNRNTPIIVVTAKENMKELIEMEGVGAFMTKPFDLEALERNIEQLLTKKD